jgi:hypothetical protein
MRDLTKKGELKKSKNNKYQISNDWPKFNILNVKKQNDLILLLYIPMHEISQIGVLFEKLFLRFGLIIVDNV